MNNGQTRTATFLTLTAALLLLPLGLKVIPDGKHKRYAWDDTRTPIYFKIVALFKEPKSTLEIAKVLNSERIQTGRIFHGCPGTPPVIFPGVCVSAAFILLILEQETLDQTTLGASLNMA